ncbi:MAG: hypothetical protein Q9224_004225 [Gallowayella concinna]
MAQVTDFIPFNSLPQYQILGGCPKTYLDREVYSQFTSSLCDATQRTAECVCATDKYPEPQSEVASSIRSVVNAGCTIKGDASRADIPATTTAATFPPPTSSTNPSAPSDKAKDKPTLSAGDIVGIVVAIAGFISTLIGTVFLERRRRAAKTSHYSWLNKIDHVYFIVINKAARPFGDHSSRLDREDLTREERIMKQLGPRNGRLALEFLAEARENDGRAREV